jgi:hypothetical protein
LVRLERWITGWSGYTISADRSQFYKDLSEPFYGYTALNCIEVCTGKPVRLERRRCPACSMANDGRVDPV